MVLAEIDLKSPWMVERERDESKTLQHIKNSSVEKQSRTSEGASERIQLKFDVSFAKGFTLVKEKHKKGQSAMTGKPFAVNDWKNPTRQIYKDKEVQQNKCITY